MDGSFSYTLGWGPGVGFGIGGGGHVTATTALDSSALNGAGTASGFAVPSVALPFTGEMVTGHNGNFDPSYVGCTISAGSFFGAAAYHTNTTTGSFVDVVLPWLPDAQWRCGLPNPF
jgi:hypothetical protein